jgi:hypothetical protein
MVYLVTQCIEVMTPHMTAARSFERKDAVAYVAGTAMPFEVEIVA